MTQYDQHYDPRLAPTWNRSREVSAPRNLFPSNDHNASVDPLETASNIFERTDQNFLSHVHPGEINRWDHNRSEETFGSTLPYAGYLATEGRYPLEGRNFYDKTFDVSRRNESLPGIPKFRRQMAEKIVPPGEPESLADIQPFGSGLEESFVWDDTVTRRAHVHPDRWTYPNGAGDMDRGFERGASFGQSQKHQSREVLDSFQFSFAGEQFGREAQANIPEEGFGSSSAMQDVSFEPMLRENTNPLGLTTSKSGGLARFQKRKDLSLAEAASCPPNPNKTRRLMHDFEGQSLFGDRDEGNCQRDLCDDIFGTQAPSRHGVQPPLSPFGSPQRPGSPLSVQFYNDGEHIGFSGCSLNPRSPLSISIRKGKSFRPTAAAFDETSPPEHFF